MPRQPTPTGVLTPAAQRVLSAAAELFYRHGIVWVGVDEIARHAGVTKKTLYDRFGSKDELVATYLRDRDARYREWLTDYVERRLEGPQEKLLATLDATAEWMGRDSSGCAFAKARAELGDRDHAAQEVIVEHKRWVRDYLERIADQTDSRDPVTLVDYAILLHEGVAGAEALGNVERPVETAKIMLRALLEKNLGPPEKTS